MNRPTRSGLADLLRHHLLSARSSLEEAKKLAAGPNGITSLVERYRFGLASTHVAWAIHVHRALMADRRAGHERFLVASSTAETSVPDRSQLRAAVLDMLAKHPNDEIVVISLDRLRMGPVWNSRVSVGNSINPFEE